MKPNVKSHPDTAPERAGCCLSTSVWRVRETCPHRRCHSSTAERVPPPRQRHWGYPLYTSLDLLSWPAAGRASSLPLSRPFRTSSTKETRVRADLTGTGRKHYAGDTTQRRQNQSLHAQLCESKSVRQWFHTELFKGPYVKRSNPPQRLFSNTRQAWRACGTTALQTTAHVKHGKSRLTALLALKTHTTEEQYVFSLQHWVCKAHLSHTLLTARAISARTNRKIC